MTYTKPLAVISDIHGCYRTLMALIAKIPSTHQVVFAGDLIDRGPDSAGVVKYAMDNNVPTVMGNHEDLMLYHHRFFHEGMPYRERNIWLWNGGGHAMTSWNEKVPPAVLHWVNRLPFHLDAEYDGQKFEISHTGFGGVKSATRETKLWERVGMENPGMPEPHDRFRIFGHTQQQEPWIEKDFAMIDTGCAYKDRGYGKLTAFLIPEKQIIQQDNIE